MFKKNLFISVVTFCFMLSKSFLFGQPTQPQPMQQEATLKWYTNYQEALAQAKKENKPLLLFFTGSDWCGWCKKMQEEIFSTPEFSKIAGNRFVFVELDFPLYHKLPDDLNLQNQQLKEKYGVGNYPTIVIIDPSENFVAETGYRAGGGEAYGKYLLTLIH